MGTLADRGCAAFPENLRHPAFSVYAYRNNALAASDISYFADCCVEGGADSGAFSFSV